MTLGLYETAKQHAADRQLDVIALLQAVESLSRSGAAEQAIDLYQTWVQAHQDHPLLYAIYFNFAVTLADHGEYARAEGAFLSAIAVNPTFAPPYLNLGSMYERLGRSDQAFHQWHTLLNVLAPVTADNINYKALAYRHMAKALDARCDSNLEDVFKQSLLLNNRQRDVLQHWVNTRQRLCKWPVVEPVAGLSKAEIVKAMAPLSLAVYSDDPLLQLAGATEYNSKDVGEPTPIGVAGDWLVRERAPGERLRVGYVSSDLRAHAVGYLMAEMFELHDRSKVEVFVYFCGARTPDETNSRIRANVDHWRDINDLNDAQAAKVVIEDGIDILVDLNGYTKDARTRLFAHRPAPVQVNWLGFPGTMGSPYYHYIIADGTIIPEEYEIYYSEKVVRLPCYQPNDSRRRVGPAPTRAEAGLPDDAFVFCCFNGTQKLTAFTFGRWMDILHRVPGSVLWLLDCSDESNERLRVLAEQHGIDRARLIFAPKKPNPDHLARYPLADLFLDTSPYGAHTTASDALWMGVPILTVPGRSFASRVCASLLNAAGLSEMICDSPRMYVERAVEIATTPGLAQRYKDKAAANRDTCTLFNTPLLVKSLEDSYERMWQDFASGALPVPALDNAQILLDIGGALDHEEREVLACGDYTGLYRDQIAYRRASVPTNPSRRLQALL